MSIEDLLEQFDEVLEGGIKIPGRRTVVDVEKLRAHLTALSIIS